MSEEQQNAVAKRELTPIAADKHGVQLQSLEDYYRAAQYFQQGLGKGTVFEVLVRLQSGAEHGFTPMQSLRAIYVVNGRPAMEGHAALAKILKAGVLDKRMQKIKKGCRGEGENRVGYCQSWREGWDEPEETTVTWAQAKKAGWTQKKGPWQDTPDRMLMWRAVGFHCAEWYPDLMLGTMLVEEARDLPEERDVTPPAARLEPGNQAPDPLLAAIRKKDEEPVDAEFVQTPAPRDEWERERESVKNGDAAEVLDICPASAVCGRASLAGDRCMDVPGHDGDCDWA